MNFSHLVILKDTLQKASIFRDNTVITFPELKSWMKSIYDCQHLFRHRKTRLITYNLKTLRRPLLIAISLKLLTRGRCYLEDDSGNRRVITYRFLLSLLKNFIYDFLRKPGVLRKNELEVKRMLWQCRRASRHVDLSLSPVYLRTDLLFGICSGGSIGHIAGVLNHLNCFGGRPVFFTTDVISTVRDDVDTHYLIAPFDFWDFKDIPEFVFNDACEQQVARVLKNGKYSFIYQRYCANNYCGVKLARRYDVPLVIEYNGSELWIARHWGNPMKYESLSLDIEILNLKAADVIVVVSRPLRDELVTREIDPQKILVNPNGVDVEKYYPGIDATPIRRQYDLMDKIVIGFIGTFGKWHGAEILARAFVQLLQHFPHYRDKVRLLMIGDGITMPLVKQILKEGRAMDVSILTGLIPQQLGPNYLAACDIYVSPHIPNPDGSPFFGSPTKLFEYMAMGKAIVASKLDQIGEILEHGITAWMVEPGNEDSLLAGLKILLDHTELRICLGQNSRRKAVTEHTWREHTKKIIEKLQELSCT